MEPEYRKILGSSLAVHPTCGMRSPVRDGRCVICALLGKSDPVPKAARVQRSSKRRKGESCRDEESR